MLFTVQLKVVSRTEQGSEKGNSYNQEVGWILLENNVKRTKTELALWQVPIIPDTQKAEAGDLKFSGQCDQ